MTLLRATPTREAPSAVGHERGSPCRARRRSAQEHRPTTCHQPRESWVTSNPPGSIWPADESGGHLGRPFMGRWEDLRARQAFTKSRIPEHHRTSVACTNGSRRRAILRAFPKPIAAWAVVTVTGAISPPRPRLASLLAHRSGAAMRGTRCRRSLNWPPLARLHDAGGTSFMAADTAIDKSTSDPMIP
jgi:hypothetical protein